MEFVVNTALDNVGRPQFIDGALMSWMDDLLEDSIREYLGVAGDVPLPPQAQLLYSDILTDTADFCYELCTFFANLGIPVLDNSAVYAVDKLVGSSVVLKLASKVDLADHLYIDHEQGLF